MRTPASTVGDPADLLHIDVDHVPGPARDDGLRCANFLTVGVDEPATVRSQRTQVPAHGAPTDRVALPAQLESNPRRRPLTHPTQRLDLNDHRRDG